MRFLGSILVISMGAICPGYGAAREAARLDFQTASAMGSGLATEVKPERRHEIVVRSMQSEFDLLRIGGVGPVETDESVKCDETPYTPTWWLSRAAESRRAYYFNTVNRIACDHGVPTRLLDAVIAQESGYNPFAVSSAGAMGLMQIMPGTARTLGLSTPFDPVANVRAGARYLRQQIDRFDRFDLALAAYNAGPERRSLQRGYMPAIPETINYVRTITTNWARLAELENGSSDAADRTVAAISAVRASGYRDVELIRYDGLNASNPM